MLIDNAPSALRERILRDGYVTIPQVLTTDEIASLAATVKEHFRHNGLKIHFGQAQPDAMCRIPDIRWLLTHEKLLAAFKEVAGRDDIQFTFHSDAHSNAVGGWHTDTQAYFRPDEVRGDDFQVYKVGIYLQDHIGNNQGLTVSEGSHLSGRVEPDKVRALPTRAGDIILFDVRIFHHGDKNNLIYRLSDRLIRSGSLKTKCAAIFRKLTGRRDKRSIFYTFGVPNVNTHEFSKRNMARQNRQNKIDHSRPPQELIDLLESHEIPYVSL